jgi:hypothetical protein
MLPQAHSIRNLALDDAYLVRSSRLPVRDSNESILYGFPIGRQWHFLLVVLYILAWSFEQLLMHYRW